MFTEKKRSTIVEHVIKKVFFKVNFVSDKTDNLFKRHVIAYAGKVTAITKY